LRAALFWARFLRPSTACGRFVGRRVSALADEVGAKPGQVAVAWVKAKGVLPVVGTRTREQLDDHLAVSAVSLSDEQIRRLDEATAIALGYSRGLNRSSEQREVMTG
jgi:aryl-alcohol dehydrogenase-like predicted oxidoreductase